MGFQRRHQDETAVREELARSLARDHRVELARSREVLRRAEQAAAEDPRARSVRQWFELLVDGRARGEDAVGKRTQLDPGARRGAVKPAPGREVLAIPEEQPRREAARPERLGPGLQWRMERAFDYDFSGVRIWRDSPLATGTTRAVAMDSALHFRGGAYQPDTPEGERVIAHELAHVVQQAGHGQRTGSRHDLEREADRAAARVAAGRAAPIALRAPSAAYAFDDGEHHDLRDDDGDTLPGPVAQAPEPEADAAAIHRAAAAGTAGAGSALPYLDQIQRAFGRHEVRGVQAHGDAAAAAGAAAMGAEAFAFGEHVAFAGAATLRAAAHEAAHVVQQRAGVHLQRGVGEAGDAHERHADAVADRVVRGESAEALLDEVAPAGGAPVASVAVQRIVRVNGQQVPPPHHEALVTRVKAIFEAAKIAWQATHESALRGWIADHDHVIAATSIHALAQNLHDHPGDPSQWVDMTRTKIPDADMRAAKAMRSRDRYARLLEPTTTSTPQRVPGLGKLSDEELLRLQECGKEEEQFWVRPSETEGEQLDTVKRKGISGADEAHITAAGAPDNPSYVVALNNHHLGHRYVGSGRQKGTGNPRTYGSKKDREGYEYKGSGLVDGHAIQVQDDQQILGPFQKDAADWSTTVKKTDGTSASYGDTKYLPTSATDKKMIECHPHNFYWENQGQGQRMRQKSIEAPLMKSGGSFLHYNHFTGESFQPNAGRAQSHVYDVPSRIHYRVKQADGTTAHYNVDNRPVADYSNPKGYDKTTHSYPDIPSGVPKKSENKNLGGLGASEHLALAKMADLSQFPNATVLHPEDPDFTFKPDFRTTVSGYESPPQTPYFAPDELEEDEVVEKGDLKRKRHFHHADDQSLITGATYDDKKDETKLSRKRRRVTKPSAWGDGNDSLAKLLAERLAEHSAASSSGVGDGSGVETAMNVVNDDADVGAPIVDGAPPTGFGASPPVPLDAPPGEQLDAPQGSPGEAGLDGGTSWGELHWLAVELGVAVDGGNAPATQDPQHEGDDFPWEADFSWETDGLLLGGDEPSLDDGHLRSGEGEASSNAIPPELDLSGLPLFDLGLSVPATHGLQSPSGGGTTLGTGELRSAPDTSSQGPSTSASGPPSEALLAHQRLLDGLTETLIELRLALSPQHGGLLAQLQALSGLLDQIDRDDPAHTDTIRIAYMQAVTLFRTHAQLFYRRPAGRFAFDPGDNAFGATGRRLASLRQFFSECAQMAVHNALSLATGLGHAANEALLDSHGSFGQNLGEEQIRAMLAAAGRPDLPVIGNLGELLGMLEAFDTYGDDIAEVLDVGIVEQAGHASIRYFGSRQLPVLNLVINTEAAGRTGGRHWIAVQLQHASNGEISVVYLDSYDAPLDYSHLFDGLRAFFGAVRRNAPPPLGVPTGWSPSQAPRDGSPDLGHV